MQPSLIGRKRPPTGGARLSGLLTALLVLVLTLPCTAMAQYPATSDADEAADDDTSQRVDESEENYRARMELRDQRYRDTPRMNTTYTPSSGTEIIDGLPLSSQEHIKDQLRDMIIESRQWNPGEDLTDYPYEPSPEAQNKTPLRNKEREAWVEQLQKFQDREAAAYANASGGQAGSSEQGESQQGQQGQEGSEQSESEKGENQKTQQASADSSASSTGSAAEPPPSTAGVSESALSFLRGANGPGGPLEEGDGQSGTSNGEEPGESAESQSASAEGQAGSEGGESEEGTSENVAAAPMPGTLELSELAMLQGMSPQPGEQQGNSASPGEMPGGSEAGRSGLQQMGSESGDRSQASSYGEVASENVQPGTLEMGDLQNLNQLAMQADGLGEDASSAETRQPADPTSQASTQSASASQASQSSDSQTQTQEITEVTKEVVVEPGTFDISELESLEDTP